MPRPQTKTTLLDDSRKEREALDTYLETLNPEQMTAPNVVGPWSVKDVLLHLHEWGQMVLRWLSASQRDETAHVPGEGYNWGQLPGLNEQIYQTYKDVPLDKALEMYRGSHAQVMETIEGMDEETLFTPGLYPWMNKNTLAAYFTSCTGSHYRWARKEIRKGLRKA